MSQINVMNLTFAYDGSWDNIFENVSFCIDTDWKLGFIGRNGRGKTTFLKLLTSQLEYQGKISATVNFEYFPFQIKDKSKNTIDIVEEINQDYEFWKLCRELSILKVSEDILFRHFDTLSNGEQTKILLATLFLKENNFLLIDEPTNHLDSEGREIVADYLNSKHGFILISHDRAFLDSCIDHVLSINKTNIEVQQGNFSSWYQNKEYLDNFEMAENEKLKRDIKRLDKASKQTADWSHKVEATKNGTRISGLRPDKGHIGRMAAKMMKRSICAKNRKEKAIEDKSKLLKNIETSDNLKLHPLIHPKNKLIEVSDLSIFYDKKQVYNKINFSVNLDTLIEKLFEEKVLGNLTEERFLKLTYKYEDEQLQLKQSIKNLKKIVVEDKKHEMNADGFLEIVKRYSDITELSLEILNEFIDKIVVHHREEINYIRQQRVEIYYKMIGFIEVPLMSKKETNMRGKSFSTTRKEQIT